MQGAAAMNTTECIKSRRSIRKFKPEPVTLETFQSIVDNARFAPSWKNTQTARYHIVTNPVLKEKIATDCVCGFSFNTKTLLGAPAIVIVSYVTGRCGYERDGSFTTNKEDRWEMFDAGVAVQTFCLSAYEAGVGTCIMGIFDDAKIAEVLNLPEDQKVGAVIAAGYADIAPDAPPRKDVDVLLKMYN